MHREDVLLHRLSRGIQELHSVRLVWLGRSIPFSRLLGFLVLLSRWCRFSSLILLSFIIVSRVQLTKGDLDIKTCLRV